MPLRVNILRLRVDIVPLRVNILRLRVDIASESECV